MINLESVNTWNGATAREAFLRCCGSRRWAERMTARRPFASQQELMETARQLWRELPHADWLEAFAAHPRIGDLEAIKKEFAATAELASQEQAGVAGASQAVYAALAALNRQYEARFGYIFIVCARGKSAAEMRSLLQERLHKHPDDEIAIAAGEQEKITLLRLEQIAP
jgi:2-oxo-4-hydroxy-4-carboxy-5-ureidoimidazoline decarboxylase